MMPHPAVLVGGAVLGVTLALLLAYREWEQQHRHQHRSRPGPDYRVDRDPESAKPVVIGRCSHCEGDVTALSGHQLPCNHYIHYTCAFAVTRKFRDAKINGSEPCRECLQSRIDERTRAHSGLRYRERNHQTCADCRRDIENEEESRLLDCRRHTVHKTCWQEMQTSGLTSCSMCMDEL